MTVVLCVRGQKVTLLTHSPGVWDSFRDAKEWMSNSEVWKVEYETCDKVFLVDVDTDEVELLENPA